MYTKCSARYDEQCGANTEMPNADFALVSSQLLGLEGLSLQQNNKTCTREVYGHLAIARYAFPLTPHACSPDVLLEGYKPETIGLLEHIGINKVSRLLILRSKTANNIIYGMWQMGAVTDEFAAVLPPLIKEHVMAIKDENYVTAVVQPAWSDTSLLCNIVKTLAEISPHYYASDWETQLKIFKYHIAKWCRVFLGNNARQGEAAKARKFGCDEEWMKHRGRCLDTTTPLNKRECC